MTRIASFAANQTLVNFLQRNQRQLNDYNVQLSTGKVSQQYSNIAFDSQRLVTTENSVSILNRYISNNEITDIRLETAATVMTGVEQSLKNARQTFKDYQASERTAENVAYVQEWAHRILTDLESYLNTAADGRYLFGGSRVTTPPVTLNAPTLAAFQNNYDGMFTTYPTTRDAHLSNFSMSEDDNATDTAYVTGANWLTFSQDGDGNEFTAGSSTITAPSDMFSNVVAGNTIVIGDTGSGTNDGRYTVKSVASDGKTVTLETTMFTDEAVNDGVVTEAAVAATITLSDGSTILPAAHGDIAFAADNTITATTASSLSSISVGETISISGSASNNGSFTVTGNTGSVLTLTPNTSATITTSDGTELSYADFGDLLFNRSADTVTAATSNAFSSLSVGSTFTIAGTSQNNGTYTVKANDGTTLTIESNKLTSEGVSSGNTYYSLPVGGQVTFNTSDNTITAADGAFTGYQAGDSITVTSPSVSQTLYTQIAYTDNGVGNNIDTIQIQDGGGTAVPGAFDGMRVGDTFTIGASTYTVFEVSTDGSQVTVQEDIGASSVDTTSQTVAGATIDNFTTQTNLLFAGGGNTITLQDDSAATVATGFSEMGVGMQVTIANATTAGNNGTYRITSNVGGVLTVENLDGSAVTFTGEPSAATTTISATGNSGTFTVDSVSSNGSVLTLSSSTSLTANQTTLDSVTIANTSRGLNYWTGAQLQLDQSANTITFTDINSGALTGLTAGQTIKIPGSAANTGSYIISSIAGNVVTLSSSTPLSADENLAASSSSTATSATVYGVTGRISSGANYYNGDENSTAYRVEEGRTIEIDVNAIDPAFEKAIRALSIVAQGEFGTAGGLDQNWDRLSDAIYLLDDVLGETRTSDPPYGNEQFGNVEYITQNISFDRLVIQQTNTRLTQVVTSYSNTVSRIENIDQLDVITKLLAQQRSVEASYQALSRIQTLTLSDYLPV